ncbi:sensor domain-containing diguanylate cyclase [Halomonas salinarum]|uniref:sensor domain-containing diguanylate cyclase n=1 Tax=Halomonas salinarum TaxID=1158993 RepID=UPI00143A02EA|nr:sensor domain-containing diguanylate cyclase [Halomonas salinarum]
MVQPPCSASLDDPEFADALAGCAEEPVHIPGAIQPSGCLISLAADLSEIRQVSGNLESMLGIAPEQALNKPPEQVLGTSLLARIAQKLEEKGPMAGDLTAWMGDEAQRFQVTPYRSGSRVVIEMEPFSEQDERFRIGTLDRWLAIAEEATSTGDLLTRLVHEVRRLCGFDRVLIYHFDERWNGSVSTESRDEGIGSFLGHHFPASDIPPQVRRLYDVNRVRSIPDATARPVPLEPAVDPVDETPLDLTLGVLRAVSPIHQRYLANMGVASTLSVALHDEKGQLSDLLSCHALSTSYRLSPGVRQTVHHMVMTTIPRLRLLHQKAETELLRQVRLGRELLHTKHERWVDPEVILGQRGDEWLALFRADGVALFHRERLGKRGSAPEVADLTPLIAWLGDQPGDTGTWSSDCLKETPLAPWRGKSCGLLAIPLPLDAEKPSWLLLFRNEEVETLRWAGLPGKRIEWHGERKILSPRNSFAVWQEVVFGRSRIWPRKERRAAEELAEHLAVLIANHEIHLLNDHLERLATHDSLTGVWNRYRIEQAIEAEVTATHRYQRDCALLLFDVDHFKAINDEYGHEAGDRVLKTVVSVVDANLRETDRLGRWGGEEFIVLATGTTTSGARELAERLRQQIATTSFEQVGTVTVSIGVSACQPEDSAKTLIGRADQAMYQAKQSGRNRIHDA